VGGAFTIKGTGFTHGSRVNFFVATSSGPINTGPYKPVSVAPELLTVQVPVSNPLGQGVVSVQVVNSDQRFLTSNAEAALLQGDAADGIPSITGIDGVPLAPNSASPDFAVNNVETVVVQGKQVTIQGTGFDTVNGLGVDLFCDCSGGKVGPFLLKPGNPGLTSTRIALTLPASGLNAPATGPGSFVVSNKGNVGSFSRKSNAVSVPIGERITITSVSQNKSKVTANGGGFSTLMVVNFFQTHGSAVVNLGGLTPGGKRKIELTLIGETRFTFSLPAAVTAGSAYVQVLGPPFVPFSSSEGPGGSFVVK